MNRVLYVFILYNSYCIVGTVIDIGVIEWCKMMIWIQRAIFKGMFTPAATHKNKTSTVCYISVVSVKPLAHILQSNTLTNGSNLFTLPIQVKVGLVFPTIMFIFIHHLTWDLQGHKHTYVWKIVWPLWPSWIKWYLYSTTRLLVIMIFVIVMK